MSLDVGRRLLDMLVGVLRRCRRAVRRGGPRRRGDRRHRTEVLALRREVADAVALVLEAVAGVIDHRLPAAVLALSLVGTDSVTATLSSAGPYGPAVVLWNVIVVVALVARNSYVSGVQTIDVRSLPVLSWLYELGVPPVALTSSVFTDGGPTGFPERRKATVYVLPIVVSIVWLIEPASAPLRSRLIAPSGAVQ